MKHETSRFYVHTILACGGIIVAVVMGANLLALAADETPGPSHELVKLGMKFDGAASCSAAKCHGSPEAAPAPKPLANEYNTWQEKDKHAQAFASLVKPDVSKNPEYGKIAANLKIDNASTSERCLNCHAVKVPAALQGEKYSLKEGVTCAACHGPSEKWREAHKEEGWTDKQRKAAGSHEALLKKLGLYDTKSVLARAEKCTQCHLAIDADMVAAGHPQPVFELAYYSEVENKHWREPGGYYGARVWAAGQVICLRDAMKQLAERAAGTASEKMLLDSYQQAMGHYVVFRQLLAAKADLGSMAELDGHAEKLKAAAGKLAEQKAAVAAEAKAIADWAGKIAPAVGKLEPDRAVTLTVLNGIATQASVAADYSLHGVEQQALSIFSLYSTFAKAENPADKDDVTNVIAKLFEPLESKKVDAAAFAKSLAEAKAKLPAK